MTLTKYHSKLVGVSFDGRQDVIGELVGDEALRFRREPDNEYDKNAVAVDVLAGGNIEQKGEWLPVGYIAKDKNIELAKVLDDNKHASIVLKEITGGGEKAYGVNVEIEYEKPQIVQTGTTKREKDLFGNEIDYDTANHVYSWKGEVYESGSQYAKKFEKPFDLQVISDKMGKKYGVNASDIRAMWELNGHTSMEFGTAIHSALELYGKYRGLAIVLERDSALHSHPVIRKAVQSFYDGRENERALYEVLVVDHANKRAGRIDRLLVNGENDYTVQDFKCNAEMKPDKLKVYWEQLGFYGAIIEANGGNAAPPQIFHYNGQWTEYYAKEAIT